MRQQRWPDRPKPWSKPKGDLRFRLNGTYKPWLDAQPIDLDSDVLLFLGTDILSLYVQNGGRLQEVTDPQVLQRANTNGHLYDTLKDSLTQMGAQLARLGDENKLGLVHPEQAQEIASLQHAMRTADLPSATDTQRARNLSRYQAAVIAPVRKGACYLDEPWYAETYSRLARLFDGRTVRRDDFPGALKHLNVSERQLWTVAGPYAVADRFHDTLVRVHDLDRKVVKLYTHLDVLLRSAGLGPVPANLHFTKRSYIHRNGELLKAA